METTMSTLVEEKFGNLDFETLFFLPPESGLSHVQMRKIAFDTYVPADDRDRSLTYYAGFGKKVLVKRAKMGS